MSENEVTWCTRCGTRFTEEDLAGAASCCPVCETKGVPCDPKLDVKVEINWHELRILGMWASNYESSIEDAEPGSVTHCILKRLENQFRDLPPLTLGGEVSQLRRSLNEQGMRAETLNVPPVPLVELNGPGAVGHSVRDASEERVARGAGR